jgi:uncharacterized protein (TIRG00374 family)
LNQEAAPPGLRDRFPALAWNALKALVSVGLLVWLVTHFEWLSALAAAARVPWYMIVPPYAAINLAQMLGAWRLRLLLAAQDIHIGYWQSLRLTYAGLFASHFLPGSVGGDAFKLLALARTGYRKTDVAACLAADRLVSLSSALLFLPSLFAVRSIVTPATAQAMRAGVLVLASAVLLGGAAIVVIGRRYGRKSFSALPGHTTRARAGRVLNSLSAIAVRWTSRWWLLAGAFGLSAAVWFISYLASWALAQALGLNVSLIPWVAVSVVVYLFSLLPVSLNGLGVTEAGEVFFLTRLGSSAEQALAVAVLLRLLLLAVSLPGVAVVLGKWRVK